MVGLRSGLSFRAVPRIRAIARNDCFRSTGSVQNPGSRDQIWEWDRTRMGWNQDRKELSGVRTGCVWNGIETECNGIELWVEWNQDR